MFNIVTLKSQTRKEGEFGGGFYGGKRSEGICRVRADIAHYYWFLKC